MFSPSASVRKKSGENRPFKDGRSRKLCRKKSRSWKSWFEGKTYSSSKETPSTNLLPLESTNYRKNNSTCRKRRKQSKKRFHFDFRNAEGVNLLNLGSLQTFTILNIYLTVVWKHSNTEKMPGFDTHVFWLGIPQGSQNCPNENIRSMSWREKSQNLFFPGEFIT